MKLSLQVFIFLLLASLFSSPAYSATWNGGGADDLASTPENWTGSLLPSAADTILFDGTSSKGCTWDFSETFIALAINGDYAGTVTIDPNSTLTLSGTYVPPDAPSGLSAVAVSSNRIDLSWNDNSSTETGFKIERKTGVNGTYSQIGTADAEATAYSDTDPSLLPGTTYYYQVRAYDIFADSSYSNEANATTSAVAPSATTNAVSNNVGTSATLNATVNPGGAETSVHFEWGLTTSYGNTTLTQVIPAGTDDVAVSADITGLTANTSYHYRIVATNSIATTNGSDVPFTTPIIAPSATTNAVSNNTAGNSATLNATVNPNGAATSVYFQWGTDTSYGNTTTTQNIPAGVNDVAVTANIAGLTLNTTYHYRVVATNSAGTTYGGDVPFTTPSNAPPYAMTNSATNKNGNSATLNGTVNPNGLETSVYFEWGLTTSYGNTTPAQLLPAGIDDIPVAANITGLSINMTYHFRVVATNTDGTTYGSDMTFTTPPITITITSPTDGSTIYRPDIMVKGNLITPGNETGVTVNGIVGMVYGSDFAVNHVPLSDGANTISVTATDTAGNTATTAITVTADASQPYVTLTASPESGVAPLPVNFSASTAIPNGVATYEMDFDGDAVNDYSDATFDNVSHLYSSPGIYYATLTVVDSGNYSYTDTIGIVTLNASVLDGSLRNIWDAFKAKLSVQDVVGGVNFMSGATRDSYQQALNIILSDLPQMISDMQAIELIYVKDDTAKYRINRVQDIDGTQVTITYYIYFMKDSDGLWKIREF
ncbi:MAG: PKD domain-containing protein [Nitrospiraceae bacterium]|nr:PKD domain-containing protein [Nitrospiraceae bacterium]